MNVGFAKLACFRDDFALFLPFLISRESMPRAGMIRSVRSSGAHPIAAIFGAEASAGNSIGCSTYNLADNRNLPDHYRLAAVLAGMARACSNRCTSHSVVGEESS
jgi:hypothetical protein